MKKFLAALLSAMILSSSAVIPVSAETGAESAQAGVENAQVNTEAIETDEETAEMVTDAADEPAAEDIESEPTAEDLSDAEDDGEAAEEDTETADDSDFVVELFDVTASGDLNESISWTLEDGVLTITGTGAMPDYASNSIPWSDYKSDIKNVVIGDEITAIGSYSFYSCTALTTVELPDSLTSIGSYAFCSCSSLTKMSALPEGFLIINSSAFQSSSLTEITLPSTITSIGNRAFRGGSLKTVYYTGTQTQWENITISDSNVTDASIYYEVTAINDFRCYFTDEAGTLQIAGSGDTIYADVLGDDVKAVIIPMGITTVEENAFAACTELSRVFYTGTQTQWNAVSVGDGNENLTNAAIYYNVLFSGNAAYTYTGSNSSELIVTGIGAMDNYVYNNSSKKSPWTSDTTIKIIVGL